MAGALAFAQPVPPISAPLPVAVTPPVSAWRAPTLQVQGAEQPVRLASLQVDVEVAGGAAETWAAEVAREHGFSDVSHTIEIFGVCSKCVVDASEN